MKRFFLCMVCLVMVCAVSLSAAAETLTISFIGDCTVGDQYKYRGYKASFTYKTRQNGMDYPFSLAADLFKNDDLTVANCEGVLTDRSPGKNHKFMTLGAATEFAQVFKLGFVDVCNTANNHSKDYGGKGLTDTHEALNNLGIGTFGDDVTYIADVKGIKIGFVGYTYPINDGKMKQYKRQMQELRDQGCTFVVASAHWGKEESYNINLQQRDYAPALIDAGADLVYGHGSHTVQPMQIYKGKVIFYSLSNFTFGANAAPKDDDTVVMQVVFDVNEDKTLTAAEIIAIPYKMHYKKDFRPYPIEDEAGKQQVWKKLVFTKKKDPSSGLPESFLTTGYANLREMEAAPAEE